MILRLHIPTPTPTSSKLQNPHPTLLNTTDSGLNFRRKLLYLESLNINPTKALHKNPHLRSAPLSTLLSVTQCLTSSFSLPYSSLGRILDMHPSLLTSDPHSHLYPILDFLLNTVLIPYSDIPFSITRCPRLLVSDPETQLHPTYRFLTQQLGLNLTAHTTLLLVSSVDRTLVPKIEYLNGLGFDYEEVRKMVARSPGLLTFSVENNFRPKVEYFLGEMKRDLEEIKRFPQYFSFSLERKIRPRHRMLVECGVEMGLKEMLTVSDGEFNARLIERRLRMVEERRL